MVKKKSQGCCFSRCVEIAPFFSAPEINLLYKTLYSRSVSGFIDSRYSSARGCFPKRDIMSSMSLGGHDDLFHAGYSAPQPAIWTPLIPLEDRFEVHQE